jgi:hypothetical protein
MDDWQKVPGAIQDSQTFPSLLQFFLEESLYSLSSAAEERAGERRPLVSRQAFTFEKNIKVQEKADPGQSLWSAE